MSGKRYKGDDLRKTAGTGTTPFKADWIDQEHMLIGTDGRLYQYHPVEES